MVARAASSRDGGAYRVRCRSSVGTRFLLHSFLVRPPVAPVAGQILNDGFWRCESLPRTTCLLTSTRRACSGCVWTCCLSEPWSSQPVLLASYVFCSCAAKESSVESEPSRVYMSPLTTSRRLQLQWQMARGDDAPRGNQMSAAWCRRARSRNSAAARFPCMLSLGLQTTVGSWAADCDIACIGPAALVYGVRACYANDGEAALRFAAFSVACVCVLGIV